MNDNEKEKLFAEVEKAMTNKGMKVPMTLTEKDVDEFIEPRFKKMFYNHNKRTDWVNPDPSRQKVASFLEGSITTDYPTSNGRGRESYKKFKDEQFEKYKHGIAEYGYNNVSIDRTNTYGNYDKNNIRFVSNSVQAHNKTTTRHFYLVDEEEKHLYYSDSATACAADHNLNRSDINKCLAGITDRIDDRYRVVEVKDDPKNRIATWIVESLFMPQDCTFELHKF